MFSPGAAAGLSSSAVRGRLGTMVQPLGRQAADGWQTDLSLRRIEQNRIRHLTIARQLPYHAWHWWTGQQRHPTHGSTKGDLGGPKRN